MVPMDVSLLVKFESIHPKSGAEWRRSSHNFWSPPNQKNSYLDGPSTIFRWKGGRVEVMPVNKRGGESEWSIYKAATMFT